MWLQEKIELQKISFDSEKKKKNFTTSGLGEEFERYLGAKFVGQTRFSLEGGCSLIPLMDELVQRSGEHHVKEFIAGMGLRGRLSVLVNVLGMPIDKLFAELPKSRLMCER